MLHCWALSSFLVYTTALWDGQGSSHHFPSTSQESEGLKALCKVLLCPSFVSVDVTAYLDLKRKERKEEGRKERRKEGGGREGGNFGGEKVDFAHNSRG